MSWIIRAIMWLHISLVFSPSFKIASIRLLVCGTAASPSPRLLAVSSPWIKIASRSLMQKRVELFSLAIDSKVAHKGLVGGEGDCMVWT